MEFKINQYPSKDEIITGTSNGTFVPKSDSLLLSLFLHNEKEHGHRKDIIRNLLSKYNEFFPVVVFSEKMI